MVQIKKHSGIYTLKVKQKLPLNLSEAWRFFSVPKNLERITPKDMGFIITSEVDNESYVGQIITYKIGLLPLVKTNWVTEITHLQQGKYFVDEQRFGPYKMWHHEHIFESVDEGTLMTDKVSYKLPFGFLGHLLHGLFIRKKLQRIFQFRSEILNQMFRISTSQ